MKIAAIIPARYASTRLEGKPLADLNGKPMVWRVYERARAASLIQGVIVATDDERILNSVIFHGGKAVMTSVSHRSGTDRVAEAALSVDAEIIVNLQGDEPLIEPWLIDAAVKPLIDDPSIQVCTLKTRITEEDEYYDPNAVKVVTGRDGNALYFSRSPIPFARVPFGELAPPPFKHIGLYVYRRDFLFEFTKLKPAPLEVAESLEQLRALENGHRIKVVEVDYNPVSVDTPEDLEKVRRIIKERGL
ncbi:MAG TPA: 3-deoxy-manno-octulosonate cytidylyltransferase [Deltaproteobacteria bacterium]|nr:MAG: 3-deoxy-manno-octulosonate cytidylyltransferase [Deltaproteobacteria bacterium GWA2_55_82]OGQ63776.1 MAG: 3-deoxy-manno-octulosonate cytidylyltransferase [Deltaproteobacteria bacterium RIFCSPLOWO2_02_FULL_55_12]OIJ73368.1 MAG: 3-deoxy-manno-octulosonate cytidylyltransferase [Deltaproteobacteria bacterium GWC2_55_46]HBG45356.1 3-deoxy-manno-octulosonate cytidylyltransferase [Deltaproteobacteria bacterium]HCY10187.1 3-deoxy-manno-octulosonate cytidylyltransferase [Deltaproteobacteria bact